MRAGKGSEFAGIGTSCMYGQLLIDVVRTCASAAGGIVPRKRYAVLPGTSPEEGLSGLRLTLIAHGYAPGTAAKYTACVSSFLQAAGRRRIGDLRQSDVRDYMRGLKLAGKSNGTLRVQLCALRAVFDGCLDMRITEGIAHAPRPVPIAPADAADVKVIMAAAGRSPRDRFIIEMLNRSKLRQGTLRLLRAAGCGSSLGPGPSLRSSGRNVALPRIIPLEIAPDAVGGSGWLLQSPRGHGPLSTRTIRRVVTRYATACGVRTTCTAIRKARAVPVRVAA